MSTFRAKSIWTAFVTAFFALLASLGLVTAQATAAEPTVTTHEHTGVTPATATTPSVRWTLPRDRALPPTMKQRIRAEAHGSSPATRQLSEDTTEAVHATDSTRSTHGTSPAGDSSPLPP
ncbi:MULTISPECIES: DUF6344 domain-containing protein [unclassified Streptomyces]|uniref:DUF6344 domain-containing protein n=1 Tax=unclassified Streptomyces TaxID=2593676 RepID=UPI000CDB8BE2|nr:DUF6344 domain-containing protein [Streptomyces sp. SM10]